MKGKSWPTIRQRKRMVRGVLRVDWCVDSGIVDGKRRQEFRSTKTAADSLAKQLRQERDAVGVTAFAMDSKTRLEAAECVSMLNGRASLKEAVTFFLEHHKEEHKGHTIASLFDEHVDSQRKRGLRERSIRGTLCTLKPFVEVFGDLQPSEITFRDIEDYLDGKGFNKPTTRANNIRYISGLFSFGAKRGYVVDNPCRNVVMPRRVKTMPEFLSADEVMAIMDVAVNGPMLPWLALGFFAGIRTGELGGLLWSDISFENKLITVRPEVAKKGVARHVTMSDRLLFHLQTYWVTRSPGNKAKILSGYYIPRHLKALLKKAGVDRWPRNAMRHTFATHHLAMYQDAGKTAFELGHISSIRLLYTHYRGLVTKADAERYWTI